MKEPAYKSIISKGTIVEVDFPYSEDPTKSKKRPSLVLWSDKSQRDFILAFITTRWIDKKEDRDVHLSKKEHGFAQTGLMTDSKIRLTKLCTLSRNRLTAKYGMLTDEMLNRVIKELKSIFEINTLQ